MMIVFTAPAHGDAGFSERCTANGVQSIMVEHARDFTKFAGADLYIDAAFDGFFAETNGPLLFHAPASVFSGMQDAPANSARFCAWPGFWERDLWEMATAPGKAFAGENALTAIGIKQKPVADIPGLIAPRILCTIINEAAFTIHDGVANAENVDIAMKLGTNYPKGPAEWANAIGCAEILAVLSAMSLEHSRYRPHPKLCEAFT